MICDGHGICSICDGLGATHMDPATDYSFGSGLFGYAPAFSTLSWS